MSRGGCSRPES
eukprot:gene1598-biopygen11008